MKELTGKLTTMKVEHKLATQILGSRIGELEADIQRVVGGRDATLEHEAEVRQKAKKAKESSKNKKKKPWRRNSKKQNSWRNRMLKVLMMGREPSMIIGRASRGAKNREATAEEPSC